MIDTQEPWVAYKLRWKRRRLLMRALRKRRQLARLTHRAAAITSGMVLGFATVRNEALRLPFWLDHHRALGVGHFLIVDNGSDDGTAEMLAEQPDVSVWTTPHSYKKSRFGMDWLTLLHLRYGRGHWCLTLDADELFVPPHYGTRDLGDLTAWLDRHGHRSMGALMIDLYPKGPVGETLYAGGQNPVEVLPYFDADNHTYTFQKKLQNLWIQGGVRARCFFEAEPKRAPTLSKVPLVKWSRRYVYVSSTHTALPRQLNHVFHEYGGEKPTAALLHTKFLNTIVAKSAEERLRREHFENSDLYDTYYQSLMANPDLWHEGSTRYTDWEQLEALGLLTRGGWD